MKIIIDDREKAPFLFPLAQPGAIFDSVIHRRLETGDYSVDGAEDFVTIERKKASELYHTVGAGRKRFVAELWRMSQINGHSSGRGYAAIVVEGSLPQVIGLGEAHRLGFTARGASIGGSGRHVTASHIVSTLAAWSVRFKIPVWFAGELDLAERLTWELLRQAAARL